MQEEIIEVVKVESRHEWATRKTEEARRKAYADPLTGSDPMFAKASRMDAMQQEGVEQAKTEAVARYEAIKAKYPWPAE